MNKGKLGNAWMKIHPWIFVTEVPGPGFLRRMFKLRFDVHHRFNLGINCCISPPFSPSSAINLSKMCPTSQSLQSCIQLACIFRETCLWRQWALAWGYLSLTESVLVSHTNHAFRRPTIIILSELNATIGKALISAAIAVLHLSLALYYSCDIDSQRWLKK